MPCPPRENAPLFLAWPLTFCYRKSRRHGSKRRTVSKSVTEMLKIQLALVQLLHGAIMLLPLM